MVEVDGPYHARRGVAEARRERYLARLGYRVLRLDVDLVLTRLAEAVEHVRAAISWGQGGQSLSRTKTGSGDISSRLRTFVV